MFKIKNWIPAFTAETIAKFRRNEGEFQGFLYFLSQDGQFSLTKGGIKVRFSLTLGASHRVRLCSITEGDAIQPYEEFLAGMV
ncbi:MAG: hypothetical protein PHQ35_10110 [Phycisphaerae bacterium]|nr:hypothetical protein [Phycisphaerae bacterium]MDD5381955.1 hypothetical protein [Phycisphaerae bacterium]